MIENENQYIITSRIFILKIFSSLTDGHPFCIEDLTSFHVLDISASRSVLFSHVIASHLFVINIASSGSQHNRSFFSCSSSINENIAGSYNYFNILKFCANRIVRQKVYGIYPLYIQILTANTSVSYILKDVKI